jgi:hypothetical protein
VKVSPDLQLARVYYTRWAIPRRAARPRKRSSARLRSSGVGLAAGSACGAFRKSSSGSTNRIGHQDRIEQILRDLHEEEARRTHDDDGDGDGDDDNRD